MKNTILSLIDFDKVDTLLEGFNQSTGFVTAILDLDGTVLSKSGWRQVCTEFHRINPETSKKCTISDTILAGQLAADKKYHFYKCLNGFVDVAVPIVIKGEHIANLFSGQFFFEEPNELFFKEQAKKYGFDEESYLEALRKVPVISEERVKVAMEFLLNMTQLISEMTFQKLEQIALNEELRTSEERYRLVLENSMDAILLTTTDGVILSANQAACAIFQRSEEDICRIGRAGIVDMTDPRFPILIEERKRTGKAKGELLMLRNDGSKFPVELSSSVYSDQSGQQRTSIIIRDITERKQSESALKLSEEKFNKAFNNSPDAVIITNVSDGKIIDANETFFKLSGYKREHAIGSSSLLLNLWNNPDDRSAYVALLKKHGSVKDFEAEFIASSGEVGNYLISGEAFTLNGEYCILAILRNITQWKLTEENVKKLNRVYTVLSDINHAIVRTRDHQQLFNEACRIAVDKGAFLMVWIGIVNTTTNKVDVVASYGKAREYLNDINIDLNDPFQSSGPTGMAVKTGESVFSNNIETDDNMIPWRENALKQGFLSSITLPIKVSGKIIGVYTMYASEADCFNEDEIKLLEEMASDISFALEFIESEKNRELAEEELEKNNALLQSIIEGTSDAIYIKNTAGKYLLFNKAAELITGKPVDEVLGKDDTFLFSAKDADIVMQSDLKIITERKTTTYEENLTTKHGKVGTFLSTKGPIFNKNGHLIGLFGVTRDITERKLAEETLRENEERYRLISDVVSDYIFTTKIGKNGKLGLSWVTGAFERITGYSFDEYIAHGGWRAALHPDDIEKDNEDFEELKKNNQVVTDMRTLAKDGRIIWVRVYAHPVWDYQNNELVGIYGGVKDITESKLAENALAISEARLHTLVQTIPDLIWLKDINGVYLSCNVVFERFYGAKEADIVGKTDYDFINRELADFFRENDLKAIALGKPSINEEWITFANDGHTALLETTKTPMYNSSGKLLGVLGIGHDITERKKAEEALRESELQLSLIYSTVGDIIFHLAVEGKDKYRFISANQAFCKATGLNEEMVIGKLVTEVIPEQSLSIVLRNYNMAIQDKSVIRWEETTEYPTGLLIGDVSIAPVFDDKEHCTHLVGSVHDITERKQIEVALNKSEDQLRKFASHLQNVREEEKVALAREIHDDLGQILVALKIDIGLLKQKVIRDNSFVGSEGMLEKFDNLVFLIDKTIKTTRRIMTGLRPEQLEIFGFIGATKSYLQQFEERHQLSCQFVDETSDLDLNQQQALTLFRILQEALNNIVKHAKASTVKIQLSNKIDTLIMEIIDNGIGFNQNNSSRPDSYGMIGMKERVVLLDGKLEIVSEIGSGTCVRVEIPYICNSHIKKK